MRTEDAVQCAATLLEQSVLRGLSVPTAHAPHMRWPSVTHAQGVAAEKSRTADGVPCPIMSCAQSVAPIRMEAKAARIRIRTSVFCGGRPTPILYTRHELQGLETHVTLGVYTQHYRVLGAHRRTTCLCA